MDCLHQLNSLFRHFTHKKTISGALVYGVALSVLTKDLVSIRRGGVFVCVIVVFYKIATQW
jgi:hypothetical protein